MPASNGKITAPVGLSTVATVLGEASTDVGTLCCSDKINDYSLIRPLYSYQYDTVPADFKTATSWARCVTMVQGKAPFPVNGTVKVTDVKTPLGKTSANVNYYYEKKPWGYFVPYINRSSSIGMSSVRAFIDDALIWKRVYPNADTTGVLSSYKPWFNLVMFDRYIHSGVAEPPSIFTAPALAYGKVPSVSLNLGVNGQSYLSDPDQIIQNGSIVNIGAVMGTSGFRVGASMFRKVSGAWNHIKSLVAPATIDPMNFQSGVVRFDNSPIVESGEYMIIPWIADGDPTDDNGSWGSVKIYPVRYATQFPWYIYEEIAAKHLSLIAYIYQDTTQGTSTSEYAKLTQSGRNIEVVFTIGNMYKAYPMTARDFYLEVTVKKYSANTTTVLRYGKNQIRQPSLPEGTAFNDSTLIFEGKSYNSGIVQVGSNIVVPSLQRVTMKLNGVLDDTRDEATLTRIVFTSQDTNNPPYNFYTPIEWNQASGFLPPVAPSWTEAT